MDTYPKYQLPSGGWTTDKERADRLWAKAGRDPGMAKSELELLRSYENGPRIWDAAALLPVVTSLWGQGLIEPRPGSGGAYRLTEAGAARLKFDDAAATWGLLSELERAVLAEVDSPHAVTPQDVARRVDISRQRAAHVAVQLKTLGLVRINSLPKQTSYELTGQGEACLKAGKDVLDLS